MPQFLNNIAAYCYFDYLTYKSQILCIFLNNYTNVNGY